MTAAELRVVREWLGLTVDALAGLLGVDERTLRRWETGTQPIPEGVGERVEALEERTEGVVTRLVTALRDAADPGVLVYRSDLDFAAAHPGDATAGWTASSHRAIIARAVQEVPGVEIAWADQAATGSGHQGRG